MKFVDRIDGTARLKGGLARVTSSLVVTYGRRRLGNDSLHENIFRILCLVVKKCYFCDKILLK